jgi:hypothetical protein
MQYRENSVKTSAEIAKLDRFIVLHHRHVLGGRATLRGVGIC